MNKKIALLLILFMVGSWCVFADGEGWIIVGLLGVGFIVSMVLIFSGEPDTGMAVWESIVDEAKPEKTEPIETVMQNPLIKQTASSIDNDRVFVGAKFSW